MTHTQERRTYSEEQMRLDCHTDFLSVLLHLRGEREKEAERSVYALQISVTRESVVQSETAFFTLAFSTASSIFSTMAASSTCRSQDALLTELTG